jgi:hypothetical protein
MLVDLNLIAHPAATLLNVGRIEYSGPFRLWREGVTPSVAKLIEAVDKERLSVMKALGLKNGDEVITSPLTFAASANCALYCNAKPVFIDINKQSTHIEGIVVRAISAISFFKEIYRSH